MLQKSSINQVSLKEFQDYLCKLAVLFEIPAQEAEALIKEILDLKEDPEPKEEEKTEVQPITTPITYKAPTGCFHVVLANGTHGHFHIHSENTPKQKALIEYLNRYLFEVKVVRLYCEGEELKTVLEHLVGIPVPRYPNFKLGHGFSWYGDNAHCILDYFLNH